MRSRRPCGVGAGTDTATTFAYDAARNLTVQNVAGARTTHIWDGENRLASVAQPGGDVTTLTYDATGLRRQKETAAATTRFVWDRQNVLLETDDAGATQASYTQTPDRYGLLLAQRRAGADSYYHFDALGSATELTDASETVTDTYRYYAFGELAASSGSTVNPFRYVGRLGYYDEAALGLQYLRARWYDPAAGRFVSVDPARTGSDWYVHTRNAPIGSTDPSGLDWTWERVKEYVWMVLDAYYIITRIDIPEKPAQGHSWCKPFNCNWNAFVQCEFCLTIMDNLCSAPLHPDSG